LRAPAPSDAEAVLAVLVARDVEDLGAPDYTLADLRDEWDGHGFVLADDARVIEAGGRIAAYGAVRRQGAYAVVHPEFEGRGLGTELLGWTESRERAKGRERHRQLVGAGNARGRELLTAAGYSLARTYSRMVRTLDATITPAPVPDGLLLRAIDAGTDADALHAVDGRSFGDAPDYDPMPVETFRRDHLGAHDFSGELSCVAEVGGRIAGFALARVWSDEAVGFVEVLAVDPVHQRRGIGFAILTETFTRFAAAGLREAQLGVASDNSRGLQLYERAGMTVKFGVETYERAVE
jgi:mycothiol synthase